MSTKQATRKGPAAIAAFIERHLPIRAVPGRPDLRLHTAVPQSGVWRLARGDEAPYWAWPWAGGLALAHHLAAHPEAVAGRRVLDLGTGSGLVAIAAARAGAARVIACDVDPAAIAAVRLNAALNDATVEPREGDIMDGPVPDVDLVLVGDLFYAPDLAARVSGYLGRCGAAGIEALVGDLGRTDLPRDALAPVAAYAVTDFGDGTGRAAHQGEVFHFAGAQTETKACNREGEGPLSRPHQDNRPHTSQ